MLKVGPGGEGKKIRSTFNAAGKTQCFQRNNALAKTLRMSRSLPGNEEGGNSAQVKEH